MATAINIVEPTLVNEAGHCYSFVAALCKANKGATPLRLWIGHDAELEFPDSDVQVEKYFFRRLRQFQSFFLYKKLLGEPGKLFISTARSADLIIIDWASRKTISAGKVYLYFHWINTSKQKLAYLKKLAFRQPNLVILGPTPSVIKVFQEAGFIDVRLASYPIYQYESMNLAEETRFRYLLYAGAARQDKGFTHVVDLVEYLQEHKLTIPVVIQTSSEHYGKYSAQVEADIKRLKACTYPHLKLRTETLDVSEYRSLFSGAISLQFYNPTDFCDRISGVTLDAFSAGSPIVTMTGTWMSRMAQRFGAGASVSNISPSHILPVIQELIAGFSRYSKNAFDASKVLREENSARILIDVLTG